MKNLIFILLTSITLLSCGHSKKNFTVVDIPKKIDPDWKKIWLEKDQLAALKAYSTQHGLFIETHKKVKHSFLRNEGACGDVYMSLVKNTEIADGVVWEIDPKGKILNKWNPGTSALVHLDGKATQLRNRIYKIDGTKVYRDISYSEDPVDFETLNQTQRRRSPSHTFTMIVDANKSFEIAAFDENMSFHKFKKTKCPAFSNELKKYDIFCVENANTKKLYVFENECT